jgi:hypothetical protein
LTYYDAWIKAPGASGEEATAWFPHERREAFFHIRDAIRAGRLRGEQIDQLAWRATVNRAELEVLMDEIYGPAGAYEARHDGGLKHLADKMRKLRAFIDAAPTGQAFQVWADEF